MITLVVVLVFILLLILTLGIVILGFVMTNQNKETIKVFLEENAKHSNDINMRLISLTTEVILSSPNLTQRDIDNYEEEIKNIDGEKLESIKKDILLDSFNPFEIQEESYEGEVSDNVTDSLNDASSIIKE